MNILFTDFCNKACTYCFARGKFDSGKMPSQRYISLKNLKICIDFLKRSGISYAGVLGGEATLHPYFKDALSMLTDQQIFVTLLSNGLIKKDHLMFLKRLGPNKVLVMVNLNHPRTYTQQEWLAMHLTGELLNQQLRLGVTIHEVNFTMGFVGRFIETHGIHRMVRLGIALPGAGAHNKFVKPADYRRVVARIVDCVEKNNRKIVFLFDCGFTRCSFTDTQLGRLHRSGAETRFDCTFPVDIGPDLTVWACFPTGHVWNRKLTQFKSADEIRKFYREKIARLRRVAGIKAECRSCQFLKLQQCAGGCAGHILNSFT
jgi:radical SAM protein with 4Fe4S-binding SPASM domain